MLVRIKETGQVIDLVPAAAAEKLNSGTAEIFIEKPRVEVAATLAGRFKNAAKFLRIGAQ